MGKHKPTKVEILLINKIAERMLELIPRANVRFASRVEEPPGRTGILFGVELPVGVSSTSNEVYELHIFCLTLSEKHNMPIGITITKYTPWFTTELKLDFLPQNIIAKPTPFNIVDYWPVIEEGIEVIMLKFRGNSSRLPLPTPPTKNISTSKKESTTTCANSQQQQDNLFNEEVSECDEGIAIKLSDLLPKNHREKQS